MNILEYSHQKKQKTYKSKELSEREREVLVLTGKGKPNRAIAEELGISAETVKKHLRNVYQKVGASNKIEALNKIGAL